MSVTKSNKFIIDIILLTLKKHPQGNLASEAFREHIAREVYRKWRSRSGELLTKEQMKEI